MDKVLFHMFSDDRFMDLTLYQYGYEQCLPLHSYGPFVRNHFLFHMLFQVKERSWLMMKIPSLRNTSFRAEWDS